MVCNTNGTDMFKNCMVICPNKHIYVNTIGIAFRKLRRREVEDGMRNKFTRDHR